MIVWSKGLGKQRLPLELVDATLSVHPTYLAMEGTIEPVCWEYSIKLSPDDLRDFLKLLAKPRTAEFLAEEGGILIPFVLRLLVIAPGLLLTLVVQRLAGLFNRGVTS